MGWGDARDDGRFGMPNLAGNIEVKCPPDADAVLAMLGWGG